MMAMLAHLGPQVPPTWPSLAPSWAPRPANLAPKRLQIISAREPFSDLGSDMAPKTAQDRFWIKFGLILDEIWNDFRLKFQQTAQDRFWTKFEPILDRFWSKFGPIFGQISVRFWIEFVQKIRTTSFNTRRQVDTIFQHTRRLTHKVFQDLPQHAATNT